MPNNLAVPGVSQPANKEYEASVGQLVQVATGVQRHETFMPAQYTRNLLSTDLASFENSMSDVFAVASPIISRTTEKAYHGTYSLKVRCQGLVNEEGVECTFQEVDAGGTYTWTLHLWAPDGATLKLEIIDAGEFVLYSDEINLTGTGTWQEVTHTKQVDAFSHWLYFRLTTDTAQEITFFVDAIQLEEGTSATDFILPGLVKPKVLGVVFEEGTTNLLDQATSEGEPGSAYEEYWPEGVVVTPGSNERAYTGNTSYKIEISTNGGYPHGVMCSQASTLDDTVYTGSAYVWTPVDTRVACGVYWRDSDGVNHDVGVKTFDVPANTWVRVYSEPVTTINAVSVRVRVSTPAGYTGTWYVDAVQLEQKAYPTRWHIGGGTRNSEIGNYTLPTTPALPFALLTMFTLDHASGEGSDTYIKIFEIATASRDNYSGLWIQNSSGKLYVGRRAGDAPADFAGGGTSWSSSDWYKTCILEHSAGAKYWRKKDGSVEEFSNDTPLQQLSQMSIVESRQFNGLISNAIILNNANTAECEEYLDLHPADVPQWLTSRMDRVLFYMPGNGNLGLGSPISLRHRNRWS